MATGQTNPAWCGEYYANISYLDAQVGKVLDKIKAMGEEDNTIVILPVITVR